METTVTQTLHCMTCRSLIGKVINIFVIKYKYFCNYCRIMLAGSDEHVYSKGPPRELQLEKSVMPPTPEHVRVQTPPR